jgi:hypothetical protein
MRITFILPNIALGGGTKVIMIHALNLMSLGHRVTLISPPPDKSIFQSMAQHFFLRRPPPASILDSFPDASRLDCKLLDRRRPVVDADVPDADVVIASWWETAEWGGSAATAGLQDDFWSSENQ